MIYLHKSNTHLVDQVLDIIAEETGIEREELCDDATFQDLGIDDILARLIITRISSATKFNLSAKTLQAWPDLGTFKGHLSEVALGSNRPEQPKRIPELTRHALTLARPCGKAPKKPLAIRLQGTAEATQKIFLLPDGSGSGMAYVQIPTLGTDIALYGLDSPYLRDPRSYACSIEDLAPIWVDEIRSVQPHGPYVIGGWSAGGYYAFEVAKEMVRRGEVVQKIVLIDSPCRLVFGALPMQVVNYLATHNLMGNWGSRKTPDWLVQHFDATITAVKNYLPKPMDPSTGSMPEVFIIWAADGVFPRGGADHTGLDLTDAVTRCLIEERDNFGPVGWNKLFPGESVTVGKMPGNHFTMIHPPNVASLGSLLRDAVQTNPSERESDWSVFLD